MPFQPSYTLTPKVQRQLLATDLTRGVMKAVRLRPQWVAEVRKHGQAEDAFHSIQIEGNTLSLEEAFGLLESPPERELRSAEQEFMNYLAAFDAIDSLKGERSYRIHAGDLRALHKTIIEGTRGAGLSAGEFRREDVTVGDRSGDRITVHHQPPPWHRVEEELRDLLEWMERSKVKPKKGERRRGVVDTWVHPVIVAGIAHHRFVWIHPFLDGNGRTARMFTTMLLHQRRYDFKYLFSLSAWYNEDRDAYYGALRTADDGKDYTVWLEYFCGALAAQMYATRHRAIKAAGVLE